LAFSKEKAHERAEKFAAKGQHDKAAREYQSIVDNDPKDIRAWLMLADCLARTGDRSAALQRYLQVADYYAGAKEHQKALAVYRQALNIDPNRLDVHYKCAQLNMDIGRVHDAIASFEQIAAVQLQTGHVSEALKTYRVIADADATIVSKRLRLAELYSRERMLVEAVDAFRVAGDVLLQSGRKPDYVRVAERLIYHKNDDRPTIRKLARVYLELGDPRRALMKLNALLQADQHDREGLELLAETFIALGKPDKATSVIAELTRDLLAAGSEGAAEAHRVLARGLDWEPADPALLRLRDEMEGGTRPPASRPGVHSGLSPRPSLIETAPRPSVSRPIGADGAEPAPARDSEPMELDLDDSDVMELVDDDDIVEEDEPAAHDEDAAIPQEMPASITDEVMSEVAPGIAAREVGGDDFDKILFEARVYIKYRLFDHSLDHIQGLLDQRPQHVGALGLKARALTELQRVREAADTHVQIAQLVMGHDPKLALTHLAAALEASPHHGAAVSLEAQLRQAGAGDTGPKPAVRVQDDSGLVVEGAGDSGVFAFDEEEDDDFGADSDFSIEVTDSEEVATPPSQPRVVENRFGLSEAGPLPDDDELPAAREATPAAGFIPRPPDPQRFEQKRPRLGDLDLRVDMDRPTGRFDSTSQHAQDHDDEEEGSFANVLDDPSEQVEIPRYADLDESGFPLVREPAALSQELDAGFDELMREESHPVDIGPAPAGGWTDLSDDLAEIRFYLDQGLDDDARAAIEALGEDHPGHPQLAALSREIDAARAQKVSFDSGSKPLLDLVTEEDQEADAYLSAIFAGGKKKKQAAPAEGRVEVTAVASEGESNARDHFDLGTAYREMGLVDGAIAEFEAAATDPNWKSRALVMVAILQSSRGDNNEAIGLLERAIEAAMSDAERCEAMYELAVLFEKLGDKMAAIEQFEAVEQGYRDRDERLVALQG
jgi:pilus assembly protein FimV